MTTVGNFCRTRKTVGRKISELLIEYNARAHTLLSMREFEEELRKVHSVALRKVEEECVRYYRDNGDVGFDKYVREVQPISRELWDYAIHNVAAPAQETTKQAPEQQAKPTPQQARPMLDFDSLMPTDWAIMPFANKIQFVSKVQHKEFRAYILGKEPKLHNFFENAEKNMGKGRKSSVKLYVTIFSIKAKNHTEEAKNLLKTFVQHLSNTGRAKLQYVEIADPENVIEVREIR